MLIDTSSFSKFFKDGDVEIIINNSFTLPISSSDNVLKIPLFENDKNMLYELRVNDESQSKIRFSFKKHLTQTLCIFFNKGDDILRVSRKESRPKCFSEPNSVIWHKLEKNEF